jgi:Tyrosine phosphatase family
MNIHGQLLATLARAETFQQYARAYTATTGMPLALRAVDSWQLPFRGLRQENGFCAMMAEQSRTCAACLQLQGKLTQDAMNEAATRECAYGLCEADNHSAANVRNTLTKLICATLVASGSCFLAGCVTRPVVNGIPNFAEMDAGIYRGGQPNAQGWQFLRALGVTNIVKLNREVGDKPADGMKVDSIPLPPATIWELFQKPCSNDVVRAVQAMQLSGTYVHCRHGRDRTGLVVGCYRMWIDGWSESAAAREMGAMGFRWSIPGLNAFWKSANPQKVRDGKKPGCHPSQTITPGSVGEN